MRIALIEVGHRGDEPAAHAVGLVGIGGVGIIMGGKAVVGYYRRIGEIIPVGRRHVLHPGVVAA